MIDEELAEATSWADRGRVEQLEEERDALLREVARASGLGGCRRTTGASAERARVAVRKAISAGLERIERADAPTGRRLRNSIHTGFVCRFEPDPDDPIEWLT